MNMLPFLSEWALRSSILILSGALLLWALRVKDASIRLAAWTAMLCGSLAIPLLTAALPKMPLVVVRTEAPAAMAPVALHEALHTQDGSEFDPQEPAARRIPAHPRRFDWPRTSWMAAVIIYGLMACALLLRLFAGLIVSLRWLDRSRATGRTMDGIEIRELEDVASPVALGIVRPAIVLPLEWRDWDDTKLNAVLAHERSHIKRHDPAVQLLSAIHRALLWYSPMSWFLHRHIVRVAEEASDDAAVAATRDRTSYAEALLDFMQRGVQGASWQGVPMARYGKPEERIHRILDATVLSSGVTRWSVIAILALGAPLAYLVAAAGPKTGSSVQAAPAAEVVRVPAPTSNPEAPVVAALQPQAIAKQPAAAKTPLATQTSGDYEFEVASVKPSIPGVSGTTSWKGGPGTNDPGRITFYSVPMESLILDAYKIKTYQLTGPDWLIGEFGPNSVKFDIVATIPDGTTKEHYLLMMQNLLAKRFKLVLHHETKELPVYNLVIAKNGPKLMPSSPPKDMTPADASAPRIKITFDSDGFPVLPPGVTMAWANDRARMRATNETMEKFVDNLSNQSGRPVRDQTGLKGEYDFTLYWAADGVVAADLNAGPNLADALQSQLGLKLESAKGPVDILVIDHVEKVPIGN